MAERAVNSTARLLWIGVVAGLAGAVLFLREQPHLPLKAPELSPSPQVSAPLENTPRPAPPESGKETLGVTPVSHGALADPETPRTLFPFARETAHFPQNPEETPSPRLKSGNVPNPTMETRTILPSPRNETLPIPVISFRANGRLPAPPAPQEWIHTPDQEGVDQPVLHDPGPNDLLVVREAPDPHPDILGVVDEDQQDLSVTFFLSPELFTSPGRPGAVILSQEIPEGWEVIATQPEIDARNEALGQVKWLFLTEGIAEEAHITLDLRRVPGSPRDLPMPTSLYRLPNGTFEQAWIETVHPDLLP